MGFDQILGYIGLAFVAISFFFADIKKLRFLNLIGALCMIDKGLPIAILNIIIAGVNIYYLNKMAGSRDRFDMIKVDTSRDGGFDRFFKAHEKDIRKFFPQFHLDDDRNFEVEMMLRNFKIVGCFIYIKKGDVIEVLVDYVEPKARDMENSRYLYMSKRSIFKARGINRIVSRTSVPTHQSYLETLGFKKEKEDIYSMDIDAIGKAF